MDCADLPALSTDAIAWLPVNVGLVAVAAAAQQQHNEKTLKKSPMPTTRSALTVSAADDNRIGDGLHDGFHVREVKGGQRLELGAPGLCIRRPLLLSPLMQQAGLGLPAGVLLACLICVDVVVDEAFRLLPQVLRHSSDAR